MEQSEAQSWFRNLSQSNKVIVLLSVMFELTIVIREIFVDYAGDCETRSRLAYAISQLNHRLTSAAWSMMEDHETYPDDVIVEMLCEHRDHPELERYFPWALERAKRYLDNRTGT